MGRYFDVDAHMEIPVAITLDVFHPFAFEAERSPWLSAGRHFDLSFAVECRHFDFRAQCRLDEAHRYLAKQVITVALKDFMWFDMKNDVEIARRAPTPTGLTVASRAQAGAS